MELKLKNENGITISANFKEHMLEIESNYILKDKPVDANKHAMKWKKLKDGTYQATGLVIIPMSFVVDFFSTTDEEVKKAVIEWLEKGIKDIAETRSKEK